MSIHELIFVLLLFLFLILKVVVELNFEAHIEEAELALHVVDLLPLSNKEVAASDV